MPIYPRPPWIYLRPMELFVAPRAYWKARRLFPFIERIFADRGYAGRKMAVADWCLKITSRQAIRRCRIEVLPKRDRPANVRVD